MAQLRPMMTHPLVHRAFAGLYNPGLAEALEFVYRDFRKKPGVQLPQVIKAVTKKFNSFENPEAKFTEDDLTKAYIADHADYIVRGPQTEVARKMRASSYGLDTLKAPYSHWIEKIVETGHIPSEIQQIPKVR